MQEPLWLTRRLVEIIHLEQLAEHGGRSGLRDEAMLESALARPRQLLHYEPQTPLTRLAALLCLALASNHPFVDGNKRVALLAAYTFLRLNGFLLEVPEDEAAETIEAVAAGSLDEARLSDWFAQHSRAVPRE